jgi:hypothetical protein
VQIVPHRLYRFSVWVRNSQNFDNAGIGVKNPDGDVLSQVRNGPGANYTHYNVTFNSAGNRSVVVFAGYWGPGPAAWEQIDAPPFSAHSPRVGPREIIRTDRCRLTILRGRLTCRFWKESRHGRIRDSPILIPIVVTLSSLRACS